MCYMLVYLIGCTSVIIIGYCLVLHHIEGDRKVASSGQKSLTTSTDTIEKSRFNNFRNGAPVVAPGTNIMLEKYNEFDVKSRLLRDKIERLTENSFIGTNDDEVEIHRRANDVDKQGSYPHRNMSTKNVHIFYSAPVNWYQKLNSTYLRDITGTATETNQLEVHTLNTVFYPMLGIYTISTNILEHHFRNIEQLGIDVVIVTWNPEKSLDLLRHILNFVKKYYQGKMYVAIEIDAYDGRTAESVLSMIKLLYKEFVWSHPALYRVYVASKSKYLPMVYVREAFAISEIHWMNILGPQGGSTVRETAYDAVFIGHVR